LDWEHRTSWLPNLCSDRSRD